MQIISGKIKKPFNIILYGTPGVGKSTFAANAPNPLFLGAEENDELECKRMPRPSSWLDFLAQIEWVVSNKPQYETLIVDTLDSVEKLLHKHVLSLDPKAAGSMAMAHGGYGRAYEKAEQEMLKLRSKLQAVRDEQDKGIILLAHSSKMQAVDTTLGFQHDTFEMSLHKKAQSVFVDWVSCVLFATYIAHKVDDENSDKVFAIGQGERVLLTEKRPGFLAKNRYNLPYQMTLDFSAFHEKYEEFYSTKSYPPAKDIIESCVGLLANISDEELKIKILKAIDGAENNPEKLMKIKDKIETRIGA